MYVKVKAVKGRIARTAPDGPFIPDDEFVRVELTPYMRRLIDVHQDVEVEPTKTKPAAKAPVTKPTATDKAVMEKEK